MKKKDKQEIQQKETYKSPKGLGGFKGYGQDSIIGIDTHVKGDLICKKSIRIDGIVEGNVTTPYKVTVGEKAEIKGSIVGQTITIYGRVEGDIEASKILEIMKTGTVYGDVKVSALAIEEGGTFLGTSKMEQNSIKK